MLCSQYVYLRSYVDITCENGQKKGAAARDFTQTIKKQKCSRSSSSSSGLSAGIKPHAASHPPKNNTQNQIQLLQHIVDVPPEPSAAAYCFM